MRIGAVLLLLVLVGFVAYLSQRTSGGVEAARSPTAYFGEVVQGDTVDYTFLIGNDQGVDLRISEVIPSFATVLSADSLLPLGGEAAVRLRIETQNLKGPIEEFTRVVLEGEPEPLWLRLRGRVVEPLQLSPQDRIYFLNVVRGQNPTQEILVINHRADPVRLLSATSDLPSFLVSVDTLREGRRYALNVQLAEGTEVGRHEGIITLSTDSPEFPVREIPALAIVRDYVSTSISHLDFATTIFEALRFQGASRRTVLVRRHEGTDFQVTAATTNVPMLDVEIVPQVPGERYLVHVSISEERATAGPFSGTLRIETNDPTAPVLELPISGTLLESDPTGTNGSASTADGGA